MFNSLFVSSVMLSHLGCWIKQAIMPTLIDGDGKKENLAFCFLSICLMNSIMMLYMH